MFRIDYPFKKEILACGAAQSAGFCLTKKNCAYIINNLGNLEEPAVLENYRKEIERLRKELRINPKLITHDLHPECNTTKYAQGLSQRTKSLTCLSVQHHQAHLASCIAENGLKTKVIGVVFDGSGFGEDGNIWGGEFFTGSLQGFRRVAHLKYTAITQNSSSMARLFDAISLLVGLRAKTDYEGQGITELERIINRSTHVASKSYAFLLEPNEGNFLINPQPIWQNIVDDLKKNVSKSIISAGFHNTIIEIVRQLCHKIKQKEKIKDVVLTGSVFQNKTLFTRLKQALTEDGFKVISHKHFSYNDSSVCFGQAVLADTLLRRSKLND